MLFEFSWDIGFGNVPVQIKSQLGINVLETDCACCAVAGAPARAKQSMRIVLIPFTAQRTGIVVSDQQSKKTFAPT